jgi:hypothetical protein
MNQSVHVCILPYLHFLSHPSPFFAALTSCIRCLVSTFHFSHCLPALPVYACNFLFYFRGSPANQCIRISLWSTELAASQFIFNLADQRSISTGKEGSLSPSFSHSHPHYLPLPPVSLRTFALCILHSESFLSCLCNQHILGTPPAHNEGCLQQITP